MAVTAVPRRAAPVPVRFYAAIGADAGAEVEMLALAAGLERVRTPRDADLLLVAGAIPERHWGALRRLHDQLPQPRATLCWRAERQPIPQARHLHPSALPSEAMRDLHRALRCGGRSSLPLLPDEPPSPWQGIGPHGQGGEGMMGGKPYGRPMAMTGEDLRDGLGLDAQHLEIGPFAAMLPPGLRLQVELQGDVVQHLEVLEPPYPDRAVLDPFHQARQAPVSHADLERRRAAHHLRCLARLCSVRGHGPLARRCLRAAQRALEGARCDVAGLRRGLRLSGLRAGIEPGLGRLDAEAGLRGPALRAAGAAEDLRSGLDHYREAGFAPAVQEAGDVRARIEQWLAEATQSLALAERLGSGAKAPPADAIEGPMGPLGAAVGERGASFAAERAAGLFSGLEWSQLVTLLASLDTEALRQLAAGAQAPA